MKRKGHFGMTLLVFAPVAYLLVSNGKLLLAVLCWVGIQAVEPLPDHDFHLPILSHRGVSHSLLGIVVVGGVLGGAGWLLGGHGFDLLYSLLSMLVGVWDWLLGVLPELSASVLAGLVPNFPPGEIVATLQQQAGGSVGRWSFAMFGFFIGAYGVLAHLLGDVITIRGIKPFLPVSHWRLSLSSLRADSPTANSALFGIGMVAIVLVVVATVPGVIAGGVPADLSPVDVAAGQSTNTTTNQTGNLSANATATPAANTTNQNSNTTNTTPTAVFANQTVNGSTVMVRGVTLPSAGFVVLDSTGPGEEGVLEESTIAVSQRLSAGTHRNVTLRVNQSPPSGVVNQSTLNSTGTYEAVLYRDSNNNSRFEFITSGRSTDRPFMTGGTNASLASDSARIIVRGSRGDPNATPVPTASIKVGDQRTNGSAVTVRSVTLPQGGFVVVHNESYLQPGVSPLRTIIGVSPHLLDGTHRNVTVDLLRPLQQGETFVAIPARDTNANKSYDYISSDGFQDVPYTAGGEVVSGRASVSVTTGTTTATSSPSTTEALPSPSTGDSGPSTTRQTVASNTPESESGGVGAWLSSNILIVGVVVVALLVVLPTLVRRS